MKLYRPVGAKEMYLIAFSGMRRFPPRLPHQPIFYPVLSREYARRIACDWNVRDEASGYEGYVLEFEVTSEVEARYPVQNAGGQGHQELWVPAEELEWFNDRLVGPIVLVESFRNVQA